MVTRKPKRAYSDQKLAKPRAKARILEAALVNFIIDPMGGVARSATL